MEVANALKKTLKIWRYIEIISEMGINFLKKIETRSKIEFFKEYCMMQHFAVSASKDENDWFSLLVILQ